MANNIAGSEIHHSPHFAQTELTGLGLPLGLHNELQVRIDKVLTAASHEELSQALIYAKGVVRGMVIAEALKQAQALDLEDILVNSSIKASNQIGDL